MYSTVEVYNFLMIMSDLLINRSKLPDWVLYIAIMHALIVFK